MNDLILTCSICAALTIIVLALIEVRNHQIARRRIKNRLRQIHVTQRTTADQFRRLTK